MSMSKSKVVIGTLLIFALGVFAGAFGANMYFKHRIERLFSKGEPPKVVHLFMKRLSGKLDLSPEQRQEIEAIVRQSHRELREVRSEFRPEIEAIIDSTFAEIEQHLDENQKQQLKEFRKRFRLLHRSKAPAGSRIARRFLTEVDRQLTLTEDQRKQVHTIVETHVQAVKEALRDAKRNNTAGTGELGSALDDLNRQTEGRLRTVLSEQQLVTYKNIWEEQRRELWEEMSRRRQGRLCE